MSRYYVLLIHFTIQLTQQKQNDMSHVPWSKCMDLHPAGSLRALTGILKRSEQ